MAPTGGTRWICVRDLFLRRILYVQERSITPAAVQFASEANIMSSLEHLQHNSMSQLQCANKDVAAFQKRFSNICKKN